MEFYARPLGGMVRRILAHRRKNGLSIGAFADLCSLNKGQISKLERGMNFNPSLDTLTCVATGMGVSVEELLAGIQ